MRYFSIIGFAFISFALFYCLQPPQLFTADAAFHETVQPGQVPTAGVNLYTILFFTGLATGGYCLLRLEWLFVVHRELVKRWTESIRRRKTGEVSRRKSPTGPALERRTDQQSFESPPTPPAQDARQPSGVLEPDDAPKAAATDKENRPDTVL